MKRFVAYLVVFCLGTGVVMADGPIVPVSPGSPAATLFENAAAAEAPVISASEIKEAAKAVAEAAQDQTQPEDSPVAKKNITWIPIVLLAVIVVGIYLISRNHGSLISHNANKHGSGGLSKQGTGRSSVAVQYQHSLLRQQFQSR